MWVFSLFSIIIAIYLAYALKLSTHTMSRWKLETKYFRQQYHPHRLHADAPNYIGAVAPLVKLTSPRTPLSSDEVSARVRHALHTHEHGLTTDAILEYKTTLSHLALKDSDTAFSRNTRRYYSRACFTLNNNLGILYMNADLPQTQYKYVEAHSCFAAAARAARASGYMSGSVQSNQAHYHLAFLLTTKLLSRSRGALILAWYHSARACKMDVEDKDAANLLGLALSALGLDAAAERAFAQAESLAREQLGVLKIGLDCVGVMGFRQGDQVSVHVGYNGCSDEENLPSSQIIYANSTVGAAVGTTITMTCISSAPGPLLFHVPHLLSDNECAHIQRRAERSGLSESISTAGTRVGHRSSRTAWLDSDSVLDSIQTRVSSLTGIPLRRVLTHSEPLQVVHYRGAQRDCFQPHHDSSAYYSRLMTTLIYLNSVDGSDEVGNDGDSVDGKDGVTCGKSGGKTWFPYALPWNINESISPVQSLVPLTVTEAVVEAQARYDRCYDGITNSTVNAAENDVRQARVGVSDMGGLAVTPRRGSAIIFMNLLPTGHPDPAAVHAGLPVIANTITRGGGDLKRSNSGDKWIANYWLGASM